MKRLCSSSSQGICTAAAMCHVRIHLSVRLWGHVSVSWTPAPFEPMRWLMRHPCKAQGKLTIGTLAPEAHPCEAFMQGELDKMSVLHAACSSAGAPTSGAGRLAATTAFLVPPRALLVRPPPDAAGKNALPTQPTCPTRSTWLVLKAFKPLTHAALYL